MKRKEHNVEKYIQWLNCLNAVRPTIIRFNLAVDASQICEILRKYELDAYNDIDAFSSKIACFPTPVHPSNMNVIYTPLKIDILG